MSQFLHHAPCPNCRSKDNLGIWDDHAYCFGCGYQERWDKGLNLERMKYNKNKDINPNVISLPLDYNTDLPDIAWAWLNNYGLTIDEVYNYKLGWSESNQRLIFPVYGQDEELLFWQGRYLGKDPNQRRKINKHITRGKSSDILHILGKPDLDTVVCCEDMISAIKIARICPAWCLFGSVLSTEALTRASRLYQNLGIYLDRDKAIYALRAHLRASLYFRSCFTIITEKDPKWYSTEQIREILQTHAPNVEMRV